MQTLFDLLDMHDVAKELLTFIFGLFSTTIGFFSALYFNRRIENRKEFKTYSNIKRGIIAEIEQNQNTIRNSFREYIHGVIFNELNTTSSDQQLTNNAFLKYTDSGLLVALQKYIRKCNLCNKQKNQLKDFRIFGDKKNWEENLQESLAKTITDVEESMKDLATLLNRL
jgi:hypothetical protein